MSRSSRWVLQLCHGYGAPFDDVARQWAALFEGSDYKVLTVFLTGKSDARVTELVGGDEVIYLGYGSKDLKGLKRKQIRDLRLLHQQYQFEFAIAHRYKPIFIATHLKSLKVFGVAHAYGVFNGFWRRRYVQRCRQRLTLLGVSNAIRDDVAAALRAYPADNIQTFYNRVNVEKLQAGQLDQLAAREHLGIPRDAYVIGNVGRLHPDKDQATLLAGFSRAIESIKSPLLVIIGDGRLEAELKAQAEALGIAKDVMFLGRVSDAWRYFKAFDVFALTSNYEPFGMVLLEAMVANVPIIATNVGGAPEVVGEGGALIELGDIQGLAAQLVSASRAEAGICGLDIVRARFSDSAANAEFKKLLAKVGA